MGRRERKEILGPQPLLHLHSRQLMFKTFGGSDVLITAPLPSQMESSFRTLGWEAYARHVDRQAASSNPWVYEDDVYVMKFLNEAKARAQQLGENATDTQG